MEDRPCRVYCAGPLFNRSERDEMAEIARRLEKAGFATFLPQRDGLELTKCIEALARQGVSSEEANRLMSQAVFALDVYQVLDGCEIILANLNGRVPDEGAVSEAAIAWSRGKPVVGYKADSRTAFLGLDNPLVAGLFDFDLCATIQDAVLAVIAHVERRATRRKQAEHREKEIASHLKLGSDIWEALQSKGGVDAVLSVLARHGETSITASAKVS